MSSIPTILILDAPPAAVGAELEVYAACGVATRVVEAKSLSADELGAELAGATILQTWHAPVDAAILERARRCLMVVQYGPGAGPEAPPIDMEAARRLGIYVTSIPDFATDDWADETMHLMLDCLRQTPGLPVRSLGGLRLGLIGLGQVGRAVARRARPCGMELWGCDPYAPRDVFENEGVRSAPLEDLLGLVDIVSLHLPLTEDTAGFLSAPRLRLMKEKSVLICTSQPDLVDLAALAESMDRGRPIVAAFDSDLSSRVSPAHPILSQSGLRHHRRRAGTSRQCAEALRRRAAQIVLHLLRGSRPAHLQIDPACPRHVMLLAGQEW
ncbi:MAG: NAD(P)-dependent oxidoreductase [Candidatus Sumerlaeia bacterium]